MHVLRVRNVSDALPLGIDYLLQNGISRQSRNGEVLVAEGPVATVYEYPTEKLVVWPERDVNVAFLVYEALWMLAGRNDVAPLKRYVKDFDRYSDDGAKLHAAYGHRWRQHFGFDQLAVVVARLKTLPDDRRSVLTMWDPKVDLTVGDAGKDHPCNDLVCFQRDIHGRLDMTVTCRSNDIIWGAYFANAYHFGVLHEYMARWIGCPVGIYAQISVNYHAYVKTMEPYRNILHTAGQRSWAGGDHYRTNHIAPISMPTIEDLPQAAFDGQIHSLLKAVDNDFDDTLKRENLCPWLQEAYDVLLAHRIWRLGQKPEAFKKAMDVLMTDNPQAPYPDNRVMMARWIDSRAVAFENKRLAEEGSSVKIVQVP